MSCCDRGQLRSVDVMLEELLSKAKPAKESINIAVADALGRVLAEDVVSSINVPPYDNSAVDGYAVIADNCQGGEPTSLKISQRIPAGSVPHPLQTGTAARIFTGATIPPNATAVVMQEDCTEQDGTVTLPTNINLNQNIRPQGQDIKSNQVILKRGHRIRAQDMGLMASIGIANINIYRPLKVAILSTGDELVEPGEVAKEGQIYNSNRYTLKGLLDGFGFEIVDVGIVEDTLNATLTALNEAAEAADIIITSGGVSVGEEDHIKAAITKLGELDLWKLAIKPGKPFAYGQVGNTPILGLPGNPGAVFVTFCILARPFLLKSQGAERIEAHSFKLPIGFSLKKPGKRREYLRTRLSYNQGSASIENHPNQSSGVLSSASWADGFAVIPEHTTPQQGELVEFWPFSELFGNG
ncbi:gephyrin-like molybdotransferase Glp [Alkalimarinus sediminis]|uniref:Molybdopterin molybdenumtransferase n=1 Tax=Alkalimarinus sediminis TaxID=1632866 RepID=A0A9E8KJ73_9ALTE|nr:gephyrin-like molybdotransferase Glp [Alkalimarinus sediminis]UZW74721.1 molybdopterin molybdotransferase MoeA [Alkalimarinus sediminis]